MHRTKRLMSFAFIGLLLFAGTWLLFQKPTFAPETITRQNALLQAYAPAGNFAAGEVVSVETGQRTVIPAVSPVVVDFADVKISTEDPDSMFNRWQRGELDLDENEGIVSDLEMQKMVEEALNMPPSKNVQLATSRPAALAPVSAGVAFDSMDYTDSGGSVPPDPEMAAGPNHVIATVNVAVAIYDKSTGTAVIGPTSAGSLFSQPICQSGLYDPNVIYDEEAQRWFLAYDKGARSANGGYCVLASQTSNPTGLWNEYFFQTNSTGLWMDYPHAGVGDDYIFMGGNIFTNGGNFVEGIIYAFNKANLYAGSPVTMITQGLGIGIDTPQPLNLHGFSNGTWPTFGSTHYFLGEPFDGVNYTLLEWNTTTLTNHGNINLGIGNMPVASVQSGGGTLASGDFRPLDFEYRNGYGWTAMTISCNPGSGTVNCVRWAQIDLASSTPPTLGPAGSGVFSSNGDYRTFPDLAVNTCGDMALGYTKTNASIFPAVWLTGRESGDAVNTLQAESQVKAGEIAYTSFEGSAPRRWGDYTGMTIDPDGLTFWYLGQYSKDTGTTDGHWGTYISSFKYDSCGGIWQGAQDSNWNNSQNWVSGAIPIATSNVTLDPANLTGANAWPVLEVNPTVANLTLATDAELTIPNGSSLTVNGTLINNGLLRQTINDVNSATTFLGTGGYGGVEINPSGNMGNTTVEIRGNQDCTTNPTSQPVQRCFNITPTTPLSATIRFYFAPSEANGNPENGVNVYHWNGSVWDVQSGTMTRSSSEDPRWVQVTGVSNYSPFVLDNGIPTAVSLSQFTPKSSGTGTAVLLIISFVSLMLFSVMIVTRRKR